MDIDAELVRGACECPDDCVVPDDAAGRVVEGSHDRPGRALRDVELRAERLDLGGADDARVDAEQLVHLRTLLHRHERPVGVRECQVPALREHEVEAELLRELLVQPHALPVELRALGSPVVGADDRRVPARGAGTDVRLLQDADVLDPVPLRQVVGGRQPVRAASDDDDVVAALELAARAPHPPWDEDVLHRLSSPSIASSTTSAT